jgi:transposase-like protein
MRYSQAEKVEIIRLVETSALPVKRTLEELDVPAAASAGGTNATKQKAMRG